LKDSAEKIAGLLDIGDDFLSTAVELVPGGTEETVLGVDEGEDDVSAFGDNYDALDDVNPLFRELFELLTEVQVLI